MTNAEILNVVATRPNNRATNLLQAIGKLSSKNKPIQVHHVPLIEISRYHDDEFFEQLDEASVVQTDFLSYQGVIFISGNAVDWAQRSLPADVWDRILKNPVFAIGEQTASVLQAEVDKTNISCNSDKLKANQQVIHPQQMNSEGLLSLPELQQVQGQRWLIVKGKGGRDKLRTGLQGAGAKVQELSVYQRLIPDRLTSERANQLQNLNPIWLISSIQALDNLTQMLNQPFQDCRIIISSDRIAERASELGFTIVAQAKDASDKQLLQSLRETIGN